MQMRTIGDTDLRVSAIGLGGMPLSIAGRPNPERAHAVIRATLDAGINFIDTADAYCLDDSETGHNEGLIGDALRKFGRLTGDDRVYVATKGGCIRPGGSWGVRGNPSHLRQACDQSLAALGVETIDLYQLHAPDDTVPFADSIGALAELRAAGKIRHVGISNVTVEEIVEARSIVPVVSVQNRCNLLDTKSFGNGVAAYCHEHDIAFLAHSPVGGHTRHVRARDDANLSEIGRRLGVTNYELMLAWLLDWSPTLVPIPGASRPESIISSARAADITLDGQSRAQLATLSGVQRPTT
jgi:aryl-alcohol dehydrogenase-like predicted oxidoreductase